MVASIESSLSVSGFFSLSSAYSKQFQLICKGPSLVNSSSWLKSTSDVNNRPVAPCAIDNRVNHLFSKSTFARRAEVDARGLAQEVSPNKGGLITNSPKKHIKRYPVFCLNFRIPYEEIDIGWEPTKLLVHFEVSVARICKNSLQMLLSESRQDPPTY